MRKAFMRAFVPATWTERAYYLFIATVIVVLAWQAFDRTPPARVLERDIQTSQVKPGGMVRIRNRMIRDRTDSEISIYRIMYDGCNLRHEYGVETRPAGSLPIGEETYLSQVLVSSAACPGPAHLDTTACWARVFNIVHQIWPVCVPLKTVYFQIISD